MSGRMHRFLFVSVIGCLACLGCQGKPDKPASFEDESERVAKEVLGTVGGGLEYGGVAYVSNDVTTDTQTATILVKSGMSDPNQIMSELRSKLAISDGWVFSKSNTGRTELARNMNYQGFRVTFIVRHREDPEGPVSIVIFKGP